MANTIQDKLAYLEETKGLIKEAIVAKGVSVSESDTFRSYANKIEAIQSGGGIAGAPSGIKFNNSTFTTVPVELFPYLEAQTDLSYIFEMCNSLTTVSLFDTSKCTDTRGMFLGCRKLASVPLFETSRVTDMSWMFSDCESLASVPPFVTSNATDTSYMLRNCELLETVPPFDTSSATDVDGMFNYCEKLTSLPLLNVSNVTSEMSTIVWGCRSLTNLEGFTGLKMNLNLGSCPLLTVDSVMNVINNAKKMTSSPKTLTLHQDVFNKLSSEQIATATAKGWNIAKY